MTVPVYPFLIRLIPFTIALKDIANTAAHTKALVIAVNGSMLRSSPFEQTMIKVFWRVRIYTRASIKLIVRSSQTRMSEEAFRFPRLTDAIVTLYAV